MRVDQRELVVLHDGVGVADPHLALPEALLRAHGGDAHLDALVDVVADDGAAVLGDEHSALGELRRT